MSHVRASLNHCLSAGLCTLSLSAPFKAVPLTAIGVKEQGRYCSQSQLRSAGVDRRAADLPRLRL